MNEEQVVNETENTENKEDEVAGEVTLQELPPQQQEAPAPEQPVAEDLNGSVQVPAVDYGYFVGVQSDGTFVFQPIGPHQGLVQMLGIHAYAGHRLDVAKDINQNSGFPLVAQQVHQLTEMVKALLGLVSGQARAQQDSRIITP